MAAPALLLSVLPLLSKTQAASQVLEAIQKPFEPEKLKGTIEDKPRAIVAQGPIDELLESSKKSAGSLDKMLNKGILSRTEPNPAGSKF